ncbi:hypothetical protein BY996DRAFT_6588768 [Phakopsora pachyrhizi]|nr:hypothetical protein BY996DRAFT_6588768 [Phakopsora pachyrhizi]
MRPSYSTIVTRMNESSGSVVVVPAAVLFQPWICRVEMIEWEEGPDKGTDQKSSTPCWKRRRGGWINSPLLLSKLIEGNIIGDSDEAVIAIREWRPADQGKERRTRGWLILLTFGDELCKLCHRGFVPELHKARATLRRVDDWVVGCIVRLEVRLLGAAPAAVRASKSKRWAGLLRGKRVGYCQYEDYRETRMTATGAHDQTQIMMKFSDSEIEPVDPRE